MISDVHAISANIHNYRNSTWSKKFLRFLHSPNNCLCRYCFTLKSLHRRHHCGLSGFVGAGLWWSVAASSSLRPVPSARCSHAKVRRNSETAKRFHAFCAKKGTGGVPPVPFDDSDDSSTSKRQSTCFAVSTLSSLSPAVRLRHSSSPSGRTGTA